MNDLSQSPMSAPEEVRAFQEFFPNPEVRRQLHYAFAHSHLPQKLHYNPRSFFWSILLNAPGEPAMEPTRWVQAQFVAFVYLIQLRNRINLGFVHRQGTFARTSDLNLEMAKVNGCPLALIRMPPPEATPGAHYAGAVLLQPWESPDGWPEDAKGRYFTLEKLNPNSVHAESHGVFCEWTAGREHQTFDEYCPLDGGATFRQRIQQHLEDPGLKPITTSRPNSR